MHRHRPVRLINTICRGGYRISSNCAACLSRYLLIALNTTELDNLV